MPPKGSQTGQDFGREAIEALLKRMEDHRGNFAVIIAGYANEMDRFLSANSGVKSRFNRYFYFSHYKPNALLEIFEMLVNEGGLFVTDKAKMKLAMGLNKVCQARDETFGNGRFIRNLLEKTIERQANRIVDISPMTDEVLSTIISSDIPSLKEYPIS